MVKCSFCGVEQQEFKGTHLLRNDGNTSYYCCSKCMKNDLNLKRDKRKVRWAQAFHEKREKARLKAEEAKEKEKTEKKEESSKKNSKKKK